MVVERQPQVTKLRTGGGQPRKAAEEAKIHAGVLCSTNTES